jgi:leukotriene-A4 hydrolase
MSIVPSLAKSLILVSVRTPRNSLVQVFARKLSTIKMPRDPNTLSNYNSWRTKHTRAELTIDFKAQKLTGNVTLDLESVTPYESEEVVLDSSYVDVTDVSINGVRSEDWLVKDRSEPYGSPLSIKIPGGKPKNEVISVNITVSTTPQCTALQWLTPAQTKGEYPYVFSQCQAIHSRSLFPCQDTPDVKSTYEFVISSPLPVVASGVPVRDADEKDKGDVTTYHFVQQIPIPSYLFALASGDIVTASIGPRSVVASAGEEIGGAKWELEKDTENFIEIAEKLIFPYVWGQYNVLILPPSFPYGMIYFVK